MPHLFNRHAFVWFTLPNNKSAFLLIFDLICISCFSWKQYVATRICRQRYNTSSLAVKETDFESTHFFARTVSDGAVLLQHGRWLTYTRLVAQLSLMDDHRRREKHSRLQTCWVRSTPMAGWQSSIQNCLSAPLSFHNFDEPLKRFWKHYFKVENKKQKKPNNYLVLALNAG